MSRVIRPESGSSLRNRLLKNIANALRYGAQQAPEEDELRDIVAFIALSLVQIQASLQQTTLAWEKRGYWLKADRFQREWNWVERSWNTLHSALIEENLQSTLPVLAELASHLGTVKGSTRGMNAKPWRGAWKIWQNQATDS